MVASRGEGGAAGTSDFPPNFLRARGIPPAAPTIRLQ